MSFSTIFILITKWPRGFKYSQIWYDAYLLIISGL